MTLNIDANGDITIPLNKVLMIENQVEVLESVIFSLKVNANISNWFI